MESRNEDVLPIWQLIVDFNTVIILSQFVERVNTEFAVLSLESYAKRKHPPLGYPSDGCF